MTDTTNDPTYHELIANSIRVLAMDGVQKANSGHPGLPMGTADIAAVLWTRFLKFNPIDPLWPDRDRFVLSAGHGSMLLYSLLYLAGFEMSLEDLKSFRQWGSMTPGHPESHLTPGVETTTGPLGQGIGNAVGMALAERWMAARFNRPGYEIIDHSTYAIASDGDLMEGISHEACALAGHLGLGKLTVFYDDNKITIDGPTSLSYSDDVSGRFEAYGWHTLSADGHDPDSIDEAIRQAQEETERPTIISCRTHIGYGSPNKQDTSSAHGEPLGDEEIRLTKENLGWPTEPAFFVPDEVASIMGRVAAGGAQRQQEWEDAYVQYSDAFPELADEFLMAIEGNLPDGWDEELTSLFETGKAMATRASSGLVLNALAKKVPNLVGGSADLTGSNKTKLQGEDHLSRDDFSGRYIHFGIREHGMGAIMNGMALHGGIRPFGGTFLVFSDYMRPAIRLAAMMGLPVVYVFTHDSIGLGEDGPTHQPVEQLMSLRLIPGLTVIRPAEATETAVAWQMALMSNHGPTALSLTRQGLATFDRTQMAPSKMARLGAYVLNDADDPAAILMGSGSEVHIALEAQSLLEKKGIATRVVSMPSWELFEAQPIEYQESVLPSHIQARVSIEAGVTSGWEHYVGSNGVTIGIDRFGASAPFQEVYHNLGLTAEAMVEAVVELLS